VNFVVSNSVDGFVVLDLHGQTKAGPFKLKNWAQTRATRMNDALTDTVGPDAPCMSCKRVFSSEGIHNRLCDNCRHKSEGMI